MNSTTKTKFFLLSDIHLENLSIEYQKSILLGIQQKIDACIKDNMEPVFIFAGDIHNSTKAYDWMKNIHAKIIYVAGNHEFWNNDYYETIDNLKKDAPKHVTFLHNDFCVLDDYLILGSTLWTDLGQQLNPDLFSYVHNRMNDNRTITAKKWYDSPENINKLQNNSKLLKKNNFSWNSFIELEENQKAFSFLNNMGEILQLFHKASPESFSSFHDFLHHVKEKYYYQSSYSSNSQIENLFQKLKKIPNINQKKLIIVSHHLPFYEELQIASFPYRNKEVKILNHVDESLFQIRRRNDYPPHYLHELSHYRLNSDNDLSIITNYHNHGKELLHPFLLSNTSLWMHGHKHDFVYSDFIGNIQIFTNPLGYQLQAIQEQDIDSISNIIQSSLPILEKEEISQQVMLWLIQNIQWDKLHSILDEIISYSEEYLLKTKNKASDKELYPITIVLKDYIQQLEKEELKIQTAYNIRCNKNYSITNIHDYHYKHMNNFLFKPFSILSSNYFIHKYEPIISHQIKNNIKYWVSLGKIMKKNWINIEHFAQSIQNKKLGYYSEKELSLFEILLKNHEKITQKMDNKLYSLNTKPRIRSHKTFTNSLDF